MVPPPALTQSQHKKDKHDTVYVSYSSYIKYILVFLIVRLIFSKFAYNIILDKNCVNVLLVFFQRNVITLTT